MIRIRGQIGEWPVDLSIEMDDQDWAQLAKQLGREAHAEPGETGGFGVHPALLSIIMIAVNRNTRGFGWFRVLLAPAIQLQVIDRGGAEAMRRVRIVPALRPVG